LQGLNTRTNLEDLLKIGEIGGQLGIVEKDILGFTKTIDKMAIAFKGEFTGGAEEVTQKIGILSNLFPKLIESGMSIPELMGRIGSSMNELGASGAANAPFIADFTQRLAPSMKALNPETILAWAAGLQEMGMTSENAASGVRSFFQYVFKESDNFSKFMKMNKRDMFEMLNTDAGTQKFLTNFSKMFKGATASQMKESLMSLGVRDMQGQDAIQNLIALNEKQGVENKGINRLQELLAISKLSFAENTSLSKEFDKMNNTLAANIEKANKKYDESKLKLGEMLAPLKLQAMELGSILLDKVIGVLAVLEGKKGLFESLAVGAGVLGVTVGILNAKFIMLAASQLLASLTNPFALTIYAGLALAALFTYLYYKSETVRGAFWAIAEGGKVFFEGFYNIGKTFIGGLIDMVMGLVDAIAGLLDGDFSKVGDGLLRSLKGAFSGTVGTVIATIGEGIDKTPKLFNAMGKGFDAGKNDFAKDNAQPLQKPAMGLGDLPNGLSFGAVPGMAKMPQIQNGGSNLLKNKDVPGMPMLPTMPNALPTEDTKNSNLSKGIDTISGGGTKPTTINITIGKLNEKIEIHTNNLDEASVDVEAKLTEMMLRVVNNANQAH
jgi:TP901 family phage tail tape measure protein